MRAVGTPHERRCCVDSERHDVVRPVGALELDDRRLVEVVVVVVADDHGVEARDLGDAARHRVQALRPDEGRRRHAVAEDGVEEEPAAVELDDARRVAVPGDREVGGLGGCRGTTSGTAPGAARGRTRATSVAHHAARALGLGRRRRRASARASGTARRGSSATR